MLPVKMQGVAVFEGAMVPRLPGIPQCWRRPARSATVHICWCSAEHIGGVRCVPGRGSSQGLRRMECFFDV
jgi:hypothetical protein